VEQSYSAHGGQEASRKREKGGSPNVFFKGIFLVTKLLPPVTHLLQVPPRPNSARGWGPSLQHMAFGGHFTSKL
jgi:hypothetical protein